MRRHVASHACMACSIASRHAWHVASRRGMLLGMCYSSKACVQASAYTGRYRHVDTQACSINRHVAYTGM
jgi:hypothetical protein